MSIVVFLLIVLSAVMHATWNLVAKKNAGNYSIIYLSFCIGFVLCLPIAIPHLSAVKNWGTILPLIIATGVLHALYGFLISITYKNGDISTLYPIVRGTGIGGAVLIGIFALGERLPLTAALGVGAVVSGIGILSYRRNRKETSPIGIFLALACGVIIMVYTILDKVLVEQISPFVLLTFSQLISMLTFLPYVIIKRRKEFVLTLKTLKLSVLGIALPALLGYLIILFVFQIADVSRVVAVRELSVVFGALSGYLFLKESFSKTRLIGVLVILTGILLIKL
ncbi:EamA family transporter [Bacteroidota bacterium]